MTMTDDLAAAERLYVDGRPGDALPLLEALCRRDPHNAMALYLLAVVRRAMSDFDGAEQAISAIAGSPVASILHVAALIARDRGDAATAKLRLRRALVCGPDHAGALTAMAKLGRFGREGIRLAAWAAVADPGDPAGWIRLRAVIAVSGAVGGSGSIRRLLDMAIDRTASTSRGFALAARALLPDWSHVESDTAALVAAEVGIAKWIVHLSAQFHDSDAMDTGLGRHLRQLAAWHPQVRAPWLGLLALEGGRADLAGGRVTGYARRVVAFGGMRAASTALDRPFQACVSVKSGAMASADIAAGFVGHALGRRALADVARRPVSVHWEDGARVVRIGDRAVRYAALSTEAVNFLALMFVFEPGLWRWMAGFGPDDVLLDIGANIGIYSIAAAGLFGVRVAALEPYGPNVAALQQNVALNRLEDRVTVLRVAAAATEATGRLYHAGGAAGAASQTFLADAADAEKRSFAEVEGIPVDTLIERGRIAFPTRIKIDVDGNERAVIEGMTRTLADPRLHSVRLEVRWHEPAGRAVVARVKSFGFEARVDDDVKNLLFTRPKS